MEYLLITEEAKEAYKRRNIVIAELGFSSYKVYLSSSLWIDIRRKVLLPSSRCRACGKKATQVHHNRYALADMNGKCLDHLIPVCGRCHRSCEFTRIGLKIDPENATKKLDHMRHENQKKWQADDRRDAWKHFFATIEEVRIYLGMDESETARQLVDKLDMARMELPNKPQHIKKKHH